MATYYATDVTAGAIVYPRKWAGELQMARFTFTNTTGGTLAAGSDIELTDLPAGRIAVFPHLSRIITSVLGTGTTLSLGHRAYRNRAAAAGTAGDVAESAAKFLAATSAATAINTSLSLITAGDAVQEFYSVRPIRVFGRTAGGTVAVNGTIAGYLVFAASV